MTKVIFLFQHIEIVSKKTNAFLLKTLKTDNK